MDELFIHTKNVYSDSACYFIGIDVEPPVRIARPSSLRMRRPNTVTGFNDRQFIERDLLNLLKSGRTWFGELFDLTTTYTFSFNIPFLEPGSDEHLACIPVRRVPWGPPITVRSESLPVVALNATFTVQGVAENYTAHIGRYFRTSRLLSPKRQRGPLHHHLQQAQPGDLGRVAGLLGTEQSAITCA